MAIGINWKEIWKPVWKVVWQQVEGPDYTPDTFSFNNILAATTTTQYESNTVNVTGIDDGASISITGGEYSIDAGLYTTTPGTINNNSTLRLRATSGSNPSELTQVSVTVGTVTVNWNIITASVGGGILNLIINREATNLKCKLIQGLIVPIIKRK